MDKGGCRYDYRRFEGFSKAYFPWGEIYYSSYGVFAYSLRDQKCILC